jgi:hypothetical protein
VIVRHILPALLVAVMFAVCAFDAAASGRQTRIVAGATVGKYRAVVTASKTSTGAAPTATATVTTYVRSGGTWKRTGSHRLDGTFFWKTITAPHGLCRFAIARTPAPVHLVVQPLITPAIGCATSATFGFGRRAS